MSRAVKRLIDAVIAASGPVLPAPVLASVASAICLAMGRPVLSRQVRPGSRGRPFTRRNLIL
jgi:lipopolysaccharide/colanic/teichoic acid biosynthesis glycosyltransferase